MVFVLLASDWSDNKGGRLQRNVANKLRTSSQLSFQTVPFSQIIRIWQPWGSSPGFGFPSSAFANVGTVGRLLLRAQPHTVHFLPLRPTVTSYNPHAILVCLCRPNVTPHTTQNVEFLSVRVDGTQSNRELRSDIDGNKACWCTSVTESDVCRYWPDFV